MQVQERFIAVNDTFTAQERALVEDVVPDLLSKINQLPLERGAIHQLKILDKLGRAGTSVVCKVEVVYADGSSQICALKMFGPPLFPSNIVEDWDDLIRREILTYEHIFKNIPDNTWLVKPVASLYSGPRELNFILMPYVERSTADMPAEERMRRIARLHDQINQYGVYNWDGSFNNQMTDTRGHDYWLDLGGFSLPGWADMDAELTIPRNFCLGIPLGIFIEQQGKQGIYLLLEEHFRQRFTRALVLALFMFEVFKLPECAALTDILLQHLGAGVSDASVAESQKQKFWAEVKTVRPNISVATKKVVNRILNHFIGVDPFTQQGNEELVDHLVKLRNSFKGTI